MNQKNEPFIAAPSFHGEDFPSSDPTRALFHIVPAPWEASVSYGAGTRNGPAAILRASTQLEDFIDGSVPGDAGIYTAPFVQCHSDPETTLEGFREPIGKALDLGKIPLLLGGEHAATLGPILEINSRGIEFGVVQFDAHADLRDSYQNNKYSHACVMRRIFDLGIPIFQIGVRSLSALEADFREENKIPHLDANLIARDGFPKALLPDEFPAKLYVTFDIDGLDPGLVPSTGTPEPGGLSWYQAIEGLEKAMQGRQVVGADVVELAPRPLDHASDFIAAKLVYKIMDLITINQ